MEGQGAIQSVRWEHVHQHTMAQCGIAKGNVLLMVSTADALMFQTKKGARSCEHNVVLSFSSEYQRFSGGALNCFE